MKLRTMASMASLVVSAAALSATADTWPEDSCVVSGTTNRACAVVSAQPLSTPLDSYWQDVVSESFENKFLTRGPSGLSVIVR